MKKTVICTVLSLLMGLSVYAQSTRIVVFTPTTVGNTYWPQVYEILEAAAADLDIDILRYEFDIGDRFAKARRGVRILRETPDIDGAIFSVAFGQTLPLLTAAEELGIPVIVQGPLFESEYPQVGYEPRKTFSSWIGYFYQDEEAKGFALGNELIARAVDAGRGGADGFIDVVGIGGDDSWAGSRDRAAGLRRAVAAEPRARLLQVVPTDWTPQTGASVAHRLAIRYPDAAVFWAASDQLAVGAAQSLDTRGLVPGRDVYIGGLDLSDVGLRAVADGTLSATCSATLFHYAEILVYLYDYIHGYDFADLAGTVFVPQVETATGENADEYLSLYNDPGAIDFSRFSRAVNSGEDRYTFDILSFHAATSPGRSSR